MASPFEAILGLGAQQQGFRTPTRGASQGEITNQVATYAGMVGNARQQARADEDQAMQRAKFQEDQANAPYRRRQLEIALSVADRQNRIGMATEGVTVDKIFNDLEASKVGLQTQNLHNKQTSLALGEQESKIQDEHAAVDFLGSLPKDIPPDQALGQLYRSDLSPAARLKAEAVIKATGTGRAAEEQKTKDFIFLQDLAQDPDLTPPADFQGDPTSYRVDQYRQRQVQAFRDMIPLLPEKDRAVFQGLRPEAITDSMGRLLPRVQSLFDTAYKASQRLYGAAGGVPDREAMAVLSDITRNLHDNNSSTRSLQKQIAEAKLDPTADTKLMEAELEDLKAERTDLLRQQMSIKQQLSPGLEAADVPAPAGGSAVAGVTRDQINSAVAQSLAAKSGQPLLKVVNSDPDFKAFLEKYKTADPKTATVPMVNPETGATLQVILGRVPLAVQNGFIPDTQALGTTKAKEPAVKPAPAAPPPATPAPKAPAPRSGWDRVPGDPIGNALKYGTKSIYYTSLGV